MIINRAGKNTGLQIFSYTVGESVSCYNLFENELALSVTITTKETDSVVILLGIYPIGRFICSNNQSSMCKEVYYGIVCNSKTQKHHNAKQRGPGYIKDGPCMERNTM